MTKDHRCLCPLLSSWHLRACCSRSQAKPNQSCRDQNSCPNVFQDRPQLAEVLGQAKAQSGLSKSSQFCQDNLQAKYQSGRDNPNLITGQVSMRDRMGFCTRRRAQKHGPARAMQFAKERASTFQISTKKTTQNNKRTVC